MKIADNNLVLNKALDKFNDFAEEQMRQGNTTAVAHIFSGGGDGERLVCKTEGDGVYRWRSEISEERNNFVRMEFFKAVCALFNGSVPQEVQKAMLLKDYGAGVSFEDADSWKNINSGKPLTARRITDVIAAIESYEKSFLDEDTTYGDYDLVGRTEAEQKGRDLALQMKLDPPKDMASFLGAVLGQVRSCDPDLALQRLLARETVELGGNQTSDLKGMLEALKAMRSNGRDETARGNLFLDGFVNALTTELRKDEPLEGQPVGENGGAEDVRQTVDIADLDGKINRFDPKVFFKGLKIAGVQEGEQGRDAPDLTRLFDMNDQKQKSLAEVLDSLYVKNLNARSFVLGHELAMKKLDAFVDAQSDDKILWAAKAVKFKDAARGVYETALKALTADDRAELMKMRYMRTEAGPRQKLDAPQLQQFIWNELKSIVPIRLQGTRHGMHVLGQLKGISEDLASGDAAKAKTGEKHLKALLKECQYGWWGDDKAVAKDLDALCKLVATPPATVIRAWLEEFEAKLTEDFNAAIRNVSGSAIASKNRDRTLTAVANLDYCSHKARQTNLHFNPCVVARGVDGDAFANASKAVRFEIATGETIDIVNAKHEQDVAAKIVVIQFLHDFADQKLCGGMQKFGAGTQEETLMRHFAFDLLATMRGLDYFFETSTDYFYQRDEIGRSKMNTSTGTLVDAKVVAAGKKLLKTPFDIRLLFGAEVSFGETRHGADHNQDRDGHFMSQLRWHEDICGENLTDVQRLNARKVINRFIDRERAVHLEEKDGHLGGLSEGQFVTALKIIDFCPELVNTFAETELTADEIEQLVGRVIELAKLDDAEINAKAQANFLENLHYVYAARFRAMSEEVEQLRLQTGKPVKGRFIGGKAGGGAFKNVFEVNFDIQAYEFLMNGAENLEYVYANWSHYLKLNDSEPIAIEPKAAKQLMAKNLEKIGKEKALYDEWLRAELRAKGVPEVEVVAMDHAALVEKAQAVDGGILARVEEKRVEMRRERAFLTALGVEGADDMSREELASARDEFNRMRNVLGAAGVQGVSAMKFSQLRQWFDDMKAELRDAGVPGVDEMGLATLAAQVKDQALRLSRMRSGLVALGVPNAKDLDDGQVKSLRKEVVDMRKKLASVEGVGQMSYAALKALSEGRPAEPRVDVTVNMVAENVSMAVDEVADGIRQIASPDPDVDPAVKKVVMQRYLGKVYAKLFETPATEGDAQALKEAANLLIDANTRAAGARKLRQVMDEVTGRRRFDYPDDVRRMGHFAGFLENRLKAL